MKKLVYAICYDGMYLAWNAANEDYDTGDCYFWTPFECFTKLAVNPECNTNEHPFTFKSAEDAESFIARFKQSVRKIYGKNLFAGACIECREVSLDIDCDDFDGYPCPGMSLQVKACISRKRCS